MEVKFYIFNKRKNSTKVCNVDPYATVECQLKEPTQLLSPTFIVEYSKISACNYAYVATWGRYYFVADKNFLTGNRCEVSLDLDVMATYKNQIANYTCFVERSASNYNSYIDDNLVSNSENLSSSNMSYTPFNYPYDYGEGGSFYMRVVNNDASAEGIPIYALNSSQLKKVLNFMFSESNYKDVLSDEVVKSFFNPFQYIVSLMWVPIDPSYFKDKTNHNVVFGWWDTGVNAPYGVGDNLILNQKITIPESSYSSSDFRRYSSRFSQYSMYIPGVGTVSLPAEIAAAGAGLYMDLCFDAVTGQAEYQFSFGKSNTFTSFKTQLGAPIQIGQMGASLPGIASGGGSAIGSLLSGNIGGVIKGLVDSAKSSFSPAPSIIGTTGAKAIVENNTGITVTVYNRDSGEMPQNQAGRPCYRNLRLGSLSGFVKCGNAAIQLDGAAPYSSEIDQVNSYLNSGFYME